MKPLPAALIRARQARSMQLTRLISASQAKPFLRRPRAREDCPIWLRGCVQQALTHAKSAAKQLRWRLPTWRSPDRSQRDPRRKERAFGGKSRCLDPPPHLERVNTMRQRSCTEQRNSRDKDFLTSILLQSISHIKENPVPPVPPDPAPMQ